MKKHKLKNSAKIIWLVSLIGFFLIVFFVAADFIPSKYLNFLNKGATYTAAPAAVSRPSAQAKPEPPKFVVTHVATPEAVKSVYMTACAAGSQYYRNHLLKILEETEINSIVINIKDETGGITFPPENEILKSGYSSAKCGASDLKEFIGLLHEKGIYAIGRIAVFQDPHLVKLHPDFAVKKMSDKTAVWKDRKGLSWIDPGATGVWNYIVALSKESYSLGFDELNFDYIRFPSDGNMNDIYYPFSEGKNKAKVLRDFYSYLHENLKDTGVKLSADLFGMTTTNTDDLNIGQLLEYALPYFDFIDPMVYPSHYPPTFMGYKNPAVKPYEVVKFSLDSAVRRVKKFDATVASTTIFKIRPWLQDFDLGAVYTADMVRSQMQATYNSGLNSWMLWDPKNEYTRSALLDKEAQ